MHQDFNSPGIRHPRQFQVTGNLLQVKREKLALRKVITTEMIENSNLLCFTSMKDVKIFSMTYIYYYIDRVRVIRRTLWPKPPGRSPGLACLWTGMEESIDPDDFYPARASVGRKISDVGDRGVGGADTGSSRR